MTTVLSCLAFVGLLMLILAVSVIVTVSLVRLAPWLGMAILRWRRGLLLVACAVLVCTGCTAITANRLSEELAQTPERYGLKVNPYDPQIGGPSVYVDLLTLYREKPAEMLTANAVDVGLVAGVYWLLQALADDGGGGGNSGQQISAGGDVIMNSDGGSTLNKNETRTDTRTDSHDTSDGAP